MTPEQREYLIGIHQTYMGANLCQQPFDLIMWEKFLNENHAKELLELGTSDGGMALFFALQCAARGMTFGTIEIRPDFRYYDHPLMRQYVQPASWIGDIFADDGAIVRKKIENATHPFILFCDNGNKRKEVAQFFPLLQQGDFVAVHDWGSEIDASDFASLPVKPILASECESLTSITRFFRKT